jgi:hypothetical protein
MWGDRLKCRRSSYPFTASLTRGPVPASDKLDRVSIRPFALNSVTEERAHEVLNLGTCAFRSLDTVQPLFDGYGLSPGPGASLFRIQPLAAGPGGNTSAQWETEVRLAVIRQRTHTRPLLFGFKGTSVARVFEADSLAESSAVGNTDWDCYRAHRERLKAYRDALGT